MSFLARYNLQIFSVIGVGIGLATLLWWPGMPLLQRTTGLMALGIVLHLWEEGRFPGGFTDLITEKLNFTASSRHFGEIVTGVLVVAVLFVPFFIPQLVFLQVAALYLGVLEAFAHTAAILIFRIPRPYSPGMATALLVLLPISVIGLVLGIGGGIITLASALWAALYLVGALALAQFIVVRSSGMPYAQFLGNIGRNVRGDRPV